MATEEGWLSNRFEEYLKEIQGILWISYIILVMIGMINEFIYYYHFDLNIFKYSGVFDFLIAPFKRGESLFFLFLAFGVAILGYQFDLFLEKRFPRFHKLVNLGIAHRSWFQTYRKVSGFIIFFVLMSLYFLQIGKTRKRNIEKQTQTNTEIIFDSKSNHSISGSEIGANSNYIFLMDSLKQVRIIPINSKVEQIIRK